jgi:hypothetical protein
MSRAADTVTRRARTGLTPMLTLAMALAGPPAGTAQQLPFDLPVELDGVTGYDPAVPTPDSILGYRIGQRHTRPAQLVDYFNAVAAASDRVTVQRHGVTHQGRPLVHAIVTSPANHARIDEIRRQNLRLSDQPAAVGDAELAAMPAIVYLGYSVHGNEASGSEAALLLLYHLAAGDGPAVRAILERAVVLVDPNLNPDGRARFVEWVNDNRGAVATADPADREHNAPWPGGRTNHYLFDLNRDWLPAVHPESRGRLGLFHTWRPQLHGDFHEMGGGSTYFFQPGVPSRDNPNTPARTIQLTAEVATYHARALDRIGALYYAREQFDDFYYGKGSTYPDVNGAVGILFEQASSRALRSETPFGELTYPFAIRNQLLTSLSTLEAAVAMRERLLRHQRDFYAEAPAFARSVPASAYVWSTEPDRTRAQQLAALLQEHRIQVHELLRPVQAEGRRFEPGRAFIVPVNQPQARLIQGMMERRTEFEDSLFYDISSWTLPLAFGLEHATLQGRVDPLVGPPHDRIQPDGGAVLGGDAAYAYVLPWERYYAPRTLYRFLDAGIRPLLATRPFQVHVDGQPRAFDRGAIIIPVAGRDPAAPPADSVHRLARRAAAEDHVVLHAVQTGLAGDGPDLGTPSAHVLSRPGVALLAGAGTGAYEVGAAWYLLDHTMAIPVSLLDVDRVAGADLHRYDVIVMAGYRDGLGDRGEVALRDWVRRGGTLVLTGASAAWASRTEWTGVTASTPEPDTATHIPFADIPTRRGAQAMGGAIFQAVLDTTHPVAFGLPDRLPVFRNHATFLEPLQRPGANVARYAAQPLLSGFISRRNLAALAGTPAVIAMQEGRGRIIVIADDPAFRAFWRGTDRLLLNAILLGRSF